MRAAGGTSVPLMLDWLMWLSMPKVNAECEKPETQNTISSITNTLKGAQIFIRTNTTTSWSVISNDTVRIDEDLRATVEVYTVKRPLAL